MLLASVAALIPRLGAVNQYSGTVGIHSIVNIRVGIHSIVNIRVGIPVSLRLSACIQPFLYGIITR